MTRVAGKHNARLVQIRRALRTATLTPDGLLAVEGPHLLGEARASGTRIDALVLAEGVPAPEGFDASRIHHVSDRTFRSLARTREPQGVIALVTPPRSRPDEIWRRVLSPDEAVRPGEITGGPILVLCGIQDPGNAGSILRSAEAFGASGVVVTPGSVGCYNDKLVRASAGSFLRLPWAWDVELDTFCREARRRGVRVLGASADGTEDLDGVNFRVPSAVLIGREGAGLDPSEREHADALVRISLRRPVESLNAAGAAAVILYAAGRSRRSEDRK